MLKAQSSCLNWKGGRKRPVENGYIDQDLHDAIVGFQTDNKLKVDGIMNPGGETEATLISRRIGLPDIKPSETEKRNGYQQTSAVPLFGLMATTLGMTAAGAAQWWANKTADDREKITRSMGKSFEGMTGDPDPQDDCMDGYERDMDRCNEIGRRLGARARRACGETAALRLSQCQKGMPDKERRQLQTEF